MGVYVGYILKTKTFFLNMTFKFVWIRLKLNNNFVEQGQLYRGEVWCMLKSKICLIFFRDYSMSNLLKFD